MRKLILTTIISLCSHSLLANSPRVDDSVSYNHENTQVNFNFKQILERIDSARDVYTIARYTIRDDGSERFLRRDRYTGSAVRKSYLSDLSVDCVALKGSIEVIEVPAGTFETCRVDDVLAEQYARTSWMAANIPFGLVRERVVKLNDPSDIRQTELISIEQ